MNEPPVPSHLTEGWPDEPSRAEVEAFARDLQGKLPELPPDAMQRIGGQMHDEMALQRRCGRRLRMIAAVSTVAASVVIGIGIWCITSDRGTRRNPRAINWRWRRACRRRSRSRSIPRAGRGNAGFVSGQPGRSARSGWQRADNSKG